MDYKDTLSLPKTDFPMRANLPAREPAIIARWDEIGLYQQLLQANAGKPKYVLHDGPPYANGHVHLGTALNKIIKDIIVKVKSMSGFQAPYVPGWDCHGMPIEHQVTKDLGAKARQLSQLEIRRRCRAYAEKYFGIQREEFRRLGVIGDWEQPYLTMAPAYEAAIITVFRQLVEGGFIYRGLRPVHWCPVCATALAEAEVEYTDHTSPSIYVRFPFCGTAEEAAAIALLPEDAAELAQHYQRLAAVIWTTTPWTLPANLAVCLNPHLEYVAVQVEHADYVVAARLADAFLKATGCRETGRRIPVNLAALDGRDVFRHPFIERPARLVFESHVTADVGTGCVHTAPGHGYEDFAVGQKYGLPVLTPVDAAGRFTAEAGAYAGRPVFEANDAIVDELRTHGALVQVEQLQHSYPHCWRCKSPLIFRATEQWFLRVDHADLRSQALIEIDRVSWLPAWGHDRIHHMMETRPDWCLSRQRAWGVPIPAFHCRQCRAVAYTPDVIRQVEGVFAARGSDAWYELPSRELLPPGFRCACGSEEFEKDNTILDVWFDAGCSHEAVLRQRPQLAWPADLYVEAVDQHRGWFQVSLITSVAVHGQAPYHNVLTHGLILDEAAKKMSKSLGNVVAPEEVIKANGAEILRLLFASVDYTADTCFSKKLLPPLLESYRKIRNTCRFLLGNLFDFDPQRDAVSGDALLELDRWILQRTAELISRVRKAYDSFSFHLVVQQLINFCAVDLSALYLDIVKDRLYCSVATAPERRSAQTALREIVEALTRLMAPILSFTAEEIWTHLPADRRPPSVFLAGLPEPARQDAQLAAKWERLLAVRAAVTKALEEARQSGSIGHSLDARVHLSARNGLRALLEGEVRDLPALFIVSQVQLVDDLPGHTVSPLLAELSVQVAPALGGKCERCWNYSEAVGRDSVHPGLCERCADVMKVMGA
ncbi:MAG: Isoleucyl-tRNA synthetase [Deltaproteobacteria bacterium]|nr:Isoleucyl-tRNA synthetase [Deltaproteobacteria bacterium]